VKKVETVDDMLRVVDKLCREDKNTVVVVEGPRDAHSLRRLGFRGRIVYVREVERLYNLPRQSKIVLLLDFDREGSSMTLRIVKRLTAEHMKVDTSYYRALRVAKRFGVNTVQDLQYLFEG
jgi:5S rRNA maturation endonuclease (ribonuclease M5)